MRRLAGAALAALLAVATAACGDDTASSSSTEPPDETSTPEAPSTTGADPASEFPPNDVAALKAIFDPLVEPLGVRLTRGVVVDRTDGWEVSDTGTHLALYVEPVDDEAYTVDDYVENIYAIAEAVIPQVFEPHPGILTFDICQEPYQAEDDRYEPFPATQIEMTREQADAFDWAGGDLPELLTLLHTEEGARIHTDRDVQWSPAYVDALEAAGIDPEA
jgi:hypothetical protein